MKVRVIADNNIIILNMMMMMMMISGEFHSVILLWSSNCINIGHQELRVSSELLASWKLGIGGQCRLRPSAGLDKEVLSFQKEVLRVSLFSNYSKKLLKTGPPVLIICTFSMEPGARWAGLAWHGGQAGSKFSPIQIRHTHSQQPFSTSPHCLQDLVPAGENVVAPI